MTPTADDLTWARAKLRWVLERAADELERVARELRGSATR